MPCKRCRYPARRERKKEAAGGGVIGKGTTYRIRVVLGRHTLAVEEKPDAGNVLSLAVAKGVHELAEGRGALDLEKHLVVVVRDLDVQVFALAAVLGLVLHVVGRAVFRHFGRLGGGGGGASRASWREAARDARERERVE